MKMSDYTYPNDTPIVFLNCEKAFSALTEKEKLYAHYLSRASWYGGLIVLCQTSLESPLIYVLLHKLFRSQPLNELKQIALQKCDFSEDEFTALLIYACGIFSNTGNYKGFGDSKFIPNLPKEKFTNLVKVSKAASLYPQQIESLLARCCEPMYSLKDNEKQLGFPYVGTTTYLSKNFAEEDKDIVRDYLKKQNIEVFNSRLFKTLDETGKVCYEIKLASILQTDDEEEKHLVSAHTVNGHKFMVTRGDYSKLLEFVNKYLLLAKEYAANENEVKMLEKYVQSFRTGSLDAHKDGSRFWIKDKGPVVESYIGFIETYRDPAGMRAEFEGFVAIVNKSMSAKFADLVNMAEDLLPLLPWPKAYEKAEFLRPDFTSLDVLTFAGSGIPSGICIPNYDEIRQCEGFKNVSLGNVIHTQQKHPYNFLNKADQEYEDKYMVKAFEVCVGLHELLGHGSGILFKKGKDGTFNFDIKEALHLETNTPIESWYEEGETYDSVFSSLGSSYEECRAECVALYLSTVPEILRVFGHEGNEADDVLYVNWLDMCLKGLLSLQMYEPKTESWLQAHSQARYVILQVLLEGGGGFVKVEKIKGEDGNPDLLLTVDRSKILSVGKPCIGKFLQRLQLYKATADFTSAKAMYDKYSAVTSEDKYPFLEYREIVLARKKPRKMFVQANTYIEDGKVQLRSYDLSPESLIQSFVDRFENAEEIDNILEELWAKDKPYFS
ncbi:dipeptidyl peptidase 3-like isoform X2 [Stegodyphus dumicola]|uniref:dipeptidyl peptidase 3-like isoform X2 n=1 Tax=Stegodyphus dumicola TaxID=202533 RepID=UPI0015B0F1B6|nr:dipeptidyl peptidase 3-like isoform X2 [Stegodyphus dumicola]